MYLGKIVETATTDRLFAAPRHPYTRMLLDCGAALDGVHGSAATCRGRPAEPASTPPPGCRFHPRCPLAFDDAAAKSRH